MGTSQYHALDFDPAASGNYGQVIWLADDDARRRVVAPSWSGFLSLDGIRVASAGERAYIARKCSVTAETIVVTMYEAEGDDEKEAFHLIACRHVLTVRNYSGLALNLLK